MNFRISRRILSLLLCIAVPLQTSAVVAAPQVESSPIAAAEVADVVLHQNGLIVGQVVDESGKGRQQAKITIVSRGNMIAETTTDEQGLFAVQGLRGGEYVIATSRGATTVRAWAEGTAPPSAVATLGLVEDGQTVRANSCNPARQYVVAAFMIGALGGGILAISETGDNS